MEEEARHRQIEETQDPGQQHEENEHQLDQLPLRVDPGKFMLGDFYFDHTWQIIR